MNDSDLTPILARLAQLGLDLPALDARGAHRHGCDSTEEAFRQLLTSPCGCADVLDLLTPVRDLVTTAARIPSALDAAAARQRRLESMRLVRSPGDVVVLMLDVDIALLQ